MKMSDNVIERYGEEMLIDGENCFGFISPLNANDAETIKIPLANGIKNNARFRLITNKALSEGMELVCHSRSFEVLRAEPVYAFRLLSHYEGILRPSGGDSDAG